MALAGPKICSVGQRAPSGILPLLGDSEQRWPAGLRGVLYILGLGWCFLGVAIISDVFMSAIERITAKKKRKFNPNTGGHVTVLIWNSTVANLTLMALGSSAPEILLSVIEVLVNDYYSGDLGPSTVVGSAAFNLLVISAVCVSAIPDGEFRIIKEFNVYVVTAVCSVFAYLWLIIILQVISPNIVEPWEGVATFLMFPVLVWTAYATDRGCFAKSGDEGVAMMGRGSVLSAEMTKEDLAELEAGVRRKHGATLTDSQVEKILRLEFREPPSRAKYRIAATRNATGGKKVHTENFSTGEGHGSGATKGNNQKVIPLDEMEEDDDMAPPEEGFARVQFQTSKHAVLENAGSVSLIVIRDGDMSGTAAIRYKTREGAAKDNSDYEPCDAVMVFEPGEREKVITIAIVDDQAYEDDEDFYVDLFDARDHPGSKTTVVGPRGTAMVLIIDDDLPGNLGFPCEEITLKEGIEDVKVDITVERRGGGTGKVSCKYKTEDQTALAGVDYDKAQGVVEFDAGVLLASIPLVIKPRGRYDRIEMFRVILSDPIGGAKFDAKTDGGEKEAILSVFIEADTASKERIDKAMSSLSLNWNKAKVGHANWRDQFRDAVMLGGDDDEDEPADGVTKVPTSPGCLDIFMHVLTLPWKVLFAFVPPTDFLGGWACFCSSLVMIGLVTAVIGDMASLAGCCLDIPDEITAITLVALGTSLPDTFASKTAAVQEEYADASICNITGSNSVNVFLGLGLPWMTASIYWTVWGADAEWSSKYAHEPWAQNYLGGAFVVKAGKLSFSVTVFSCCAFAAVIVLFIRRIKLGGELGGPFVWKVITSCFLVFLWVIYIAASCAYIISHEDE
jgi:solute carrier family 8 (sodium/calcium exchanger)